jgi:hypothetical protein
MSVVKSYRSSSQHKHVERHFKSISFDQHGFLAQEINVRVYFTLIKYYMSMVKSYRSSSQHKHVERHFKSISFDQHGNFLA